jgi:hypothetical protein
MWAIAAATALNTTPEALQEALAQKNQFHIPTDPLPQKIAILMETREEWQGTATHLKLQLDLSDAPNHLSRKLKQVQAIMRQQGIDIAFPPHEKSIVRSTALNQTKKKRRESSISIVRSSALIKPCNPYCDSKA